MHEKLMKMMEKKKARKVGPTEQKAKMGVLKELKDDMSSEMGGSLKDMMAKKVSVMAGNKEDLKKGLDKAKELVGEIPNGEEEGQLEDMEAEESGEAGMEEAADDVESEIAKLEEKLKKLKAMRGESEEESEEDESEEA